MLRAQFLIILSNIQTYGQDPVDEEKSVSEQDPDPSDSEQDLDPATNPDPQINDELEIVEQALIVPLRKLVLTGAARRVVNVPFHQTALLTWNQTLPYGLNAAFGNGSIASMSNYSQEENASEHLMFKTIQLILV
ncbi:MAG: hypothetical protein GEU26_04980 [Nitrososphaeraceae archaeon]|nr:hypothetical protein [Nitrososphaeraceae archaeon]